MVGYHERSAEIWLGTAFPELDDKSPRQVLAEADGKGRLMDILNEFSKLAGSEDQQGFLDFMKARVESAPAL